MSDHHAKQAAEQQRRFPGFSAPGSLPISIFPSLISGVYEIPEFQSHTTHFRMEQLPLTVLRLSKITPALCRRPSLYLMPAFPCAVFCFVCAFFPTHKHVGAVSIICLWPPLKAIHKRIYVHVCVPRPLVWSSSVPQTTNANVFTVIFKACFAIAETYS